VISVSPGWAVADCGLKALGMDHGNPTLASGGKVWFCSDEHVTFSPPRPVGDRLLLTPAHVDPTLALHERAWLLDGDEVSGSWDIDLRGW
jgi:D-serine deaminase-like pyridoxal phosphate-dependent protein